MATLKLKKSDGAGKRAITDTNLLLTITIVVFAVMYIGAMLFLGRGFLRWQTFFNILNTNASLIITAIGLSIVMICGSIDISVGGVVGLVTMCCAVNLDYMGGDPMTALLISLGMDYALLTTDLPITMFMLYCLFFHPEKAVQHKTIPQGSHQ